MRVSPHEIRRIVAMYYGGRRICYIARVLGCSNTTVHNVLVRQKVPLRQDVYNRKAYAPSPKEIEVATAKIRSTWGPQEEQERRDATPYEFPVFNSRLKPI